MTLLLRPVKRDELWPMLELAVSAFDGKDPIDNALFPPAVRESPQWDNDLLRWRVQSAERVLDNEDRHLIVVVEVSEDSADKIVGMAYWVSPSPSIAEAAQPESTEEEKARAREEKLKNLPPTLDRKALEEIQKIMDAEVERAIGLKEADDMWTLNVIAVDSEYRRRGIGTMLLNYGIKGAAEQGKGIFFFAAPEAVRMYLANGFEIVGKVMYGHEHTLMVKRVKPS